MLSYEDMEAGLRECPKCGAITYVDNLRWTYDCHGIPMRKVCPDCYKEIMVDRGYDGELYDDTDDLDALLGWENF